MVIFSVRSLMPEQSMRWEAHDETDLKMCCITAARFAARLKNDSSFPCSGPACVSVLQIPDPPSDSHEGTLVFHAIRHTRETDVPLAPAFLAGMLSESEVGGHSMSVDLRYSSFEVLPQSIRDILPSVKPVEKKLRRKREGVRHGR